MADLQIVEGVSGMYFYHLAKPGHHWRSLCGTATMSTSMGIDQWESVCRNDRIHYKWCQECKALAEKEIRRG